MGMDEIERRLIWIIGSSRSGSTWLTRMLAAHDDVVAIDDPHIGHHLSVWRPISLAWGTATRLPELQTLGDVKGRHDDYFFSERYRDAWAPALRDLICGRFAAQVDELESQRGVREPRIAVKDPGASGVAELISELFPRSRLVFLLRDGRDVVDSWLDAYQEGSWAQEGGAFPVAEDGRLPLIRWLASVWRFRMEAVQEAYASLPSAQRLVVRYEELLSDTPAQLGRIAGLLGISAGPDELERIARERGFRALRPAERGNGKEVRAAHPGAWRENL